MTEFEFDLADRVQKIKSINKQYDLENNAFISFSGGKGGMTADEALGGQECRR